MRVGDGALEVLQRFPRARGIGDDFAQRLPHVVGIGISRAGAGLDARFGVAADQRDVDAVHRGAADDADRRGFRVHSAGPISVVRAPMPSISPSSRSPGATGPTPAGVPVKIRSPGPRR